MTELDSQSQALRDAHKATKDARVELNYYKGLAGMYQIVYDEQVEVSGAIMIIKGIAAELKSELNEYQSKNGQNERVKKSQARINILTSQLGIISKVQTDYYILKIQNKGLVSDKYQLREEVAQLKEMLRLDALNQKEL